jgi:hypothetical protein
MHTPGPWIVLSDSPAAIRTIDGSNIAPEVCHLEDARLMAAAPDMLAALQFAVGRVELANAEGNPILSAWLTDARAAIARATPQN